jgi:hypothetical protein
MLIIPRLGNTCPPTNQQINHERSEEELKTTGISFGTCPNLLIIFTSGQLQGLGN